jgi:diguanylate cyclase (GGDEF)-like protein
MLKLPMKSPPPNEADPGLLALLSKVEPVALGLVAVISGGALLSWFLHTTDAFAPWSQNPRPPTAVMLLFVAVSLFLTAPRRRGLLSVIGEGVALGLLATPIVAALAYAGVLPIPAARLGMLPPPVSVIIGFMAFVSLLWNRQTSGIRSILADVGAAVAIAFTLFLVGGYVFNGIEIIGAVRAPLQALPTVVAMGLVAFALLTRRAVAGRAFRFLLDAGIGSRIARAVLPAIVFTPFVIFQGVNVLDRTGLAPRVLSQAIAAPLLVVATVVVVVWMGSYTNWIERQLRRQSQTDELTGVLNQRGFESAADYLGRTALRNGHGLIAFFFDLDNLKRANDLLGHTAGSQVIQRFADLLAVAFRTDDIIARVGGDEFVVLAPAPIESAEAMLSRLARVVETLNANERLPVPISYSVGYAELAPGTDGDVQRLIAEADLRMYAEKTRKRAA